jgi:hypothetical protein
MADLVVELRNRWVDHEMEGGRRCWRRLGSLACGEGDRLLLLVAGRCRLRGKPGAEGEDGGRIGAAAGVRSPLRPTVKNVGLWPLKLRWRQGERSVAGWKENGAAASWLLAKTNERLRGEGKVRRWFKSKRGSLCVSARAQKRK